MNQECRREINHAYHEEITEKDPYVCHWMVDWQAGEFCNELAIWGMSIGGTKFRFCEQHKTELENRLNCPLPFKLDGWLDGFTPRQREIMIARAGSTWTEVETKFPKEEMQELYALLYGKEIRCRTCGRTHNRPACMPAQEEQRQKFLKRLEKAFGGEQ